MLKLFGCQNLSYVYHVNDNKVLSFSNAEQLATSNMNHFELNFVANANVVSPGATSKLPQGDDLTYLTGNIGKYDR